MSGDSRDGGRRRRLIKRDGQRCQSGVEILELTEDEVLRKPPILLSLIEVEVEVEVEVVVGMKKKKTTKKTDGRGYLYLPCPMHPRE